MGGSFAFALPVTMFGFGCAFLLLWRWHAPAALCWALGFLFGAAAFAASLLTSMLTAYRSVVLADFAFLLSFFFYGQAVAKRVAAGGRTLLVVRLAIGAGAMACSVWSVLIVDNLHVELVTNDFGCAALIALPLLRLRRRRHPPLDRALIALTLIIAADGLIRASTVLMTAPDHIAGFATSEYAFAMQATATVLADLFALTAMAATGLDLLSRYRREALIDPLSGLCNRRGFEDRVAASRAEHGVAGSVITCDIDLFKHVNDRFGHAAGDAVIQGLAGIIRAALPADAIAARFGGEEFVIHLPRCTAGEAKALAELIRLTIAERDWRDAGIDLPLTASFGIAGTLPTDFSLHDSIERADEALYEAKRAGRNRVSVKLSLLPLDEPLRAASL